MITLIAANTRSVFWEKPGYYYFMNGWKFSTDQTSKKEHSLRKHFLSKDALQITGLHIVG